MNFVEAITKTMQDLHANPTWQREAMIGQGIDPRDANIMVQENSKKSETERLVESIRARIDAGEQIAPGELLAIGARNPELARVVLAMQTPEKPKLQFNPVTGEVFDMRTGTPYNDGGVIPPGGAADPTGNAPTLPPLVSDGGEPVQIPSEIQGNPKAAQVFLQKVAEAKAKAPTQGAAEVKLESGVNKIESLSDILAKTRARVEKSNFSTGAIGAIMQNIPGTEAHDIQNSVDTIKANIGFDRLQEMRDNSKTGGALGNISDNENKLLQKTVASLEQSQTKKQFIENLDRVNAQYKASTERLKKAYLQDYGTLEGFNFGDAPATEQQKPASGGGKFLGFE